MYRIAVDPAKHRVEIAFADTYLDIDAAAFSRDFRAGASAARGTGGHFDLLADYTAAPVMPQDRTSTVAPEIAWCADNGLRRAAHVVHSAIARMQLQRLAASDNQRVFAGCDDAMAWLDSSG